MPSDARRRAPATARNRDPILAVLRRVLPTAGMVLEVASGSGEHAAHFAPWLPHLDWQPSDCAAESLASIAAWVAHAAAANLRPPLWLDVTAPRWPLSEAVAVVCINLLHIAPWAACVGLLAGAARLLPPGAPLYLYGPFQRGGRHTAPSNTAFDESLRAQNPAWDIRDLDEVVATAATRDLVLDEIVAMPANNLSVVFRRQT